MKNAPLVFALPALLGVSLLAGPAGANCPGMNCCDHVHFARHQDVAAARSAITTEDGKVTMVLTDRVVALQLSDRTLHRVQRELHDKQEDAQDNVFAAVIVNVVTKTVGRLLDHSFACRLHDLSDVAYQNGRLVLTERNGRRLFEDAEVCQSDVLASFSPVDAMSFVREFHRLKAEGF